MFQINYCNYPSTAIVQNCTLKIVQLIATSISALILSLVAIYLLINYKKRYYNNLLWCHNGRSALELLLVILSTIELSIAYLPLDTLKFSLKRYILEPFTVSNSICYLYSTIVLAIFHRIVEIKHKPGYFYVSLGMTILMMSFRVYNFNKAASELGIFHMHSFSQGLTLIVLTLFFCLNCLTIWKENCSQRNVFKDDNLPNNIGYKHSSSTFISKIVFWWLTPLLWRGFKEPLEIEDLGILSEEENAKAYYDQFLLIYKAKSNQSLWLCYIKSHWKMIGLGWLLKLFGDLASIVGPLSIHQIIIYIENHYKKLDQKNTIIDEKEKISIPEIGIHYPNWDELISNGWTIAWLVLLASLAQGSFSQASTHIVNMVGIRIRTSLLGLVYRKTLLMRINKGNTLESLDDFNNNKNCGTITNLMSEDALNVMMFFWIAHYIWAIPLKIVIVMHLLYLQLGISAIIGSLICILTMTPLQFIIGKAMSKNSQEASERTDERLKLTNDTLLGIKIIKLNAWENVFRDKIHDSRIKELKFLNKDSFYWTLMCFVTHISSIMVTFVTLAIFFTYENISLNLKPIIVNTTNYQKEDIFEKNHTNIRVEFTASRLFSALALFNQLTVPLLIFPIVIPIIISSITSTRRFNKFLQLPEVQKNFEGVRNMARILSRSNASLDMYEENNENKLEQTVCTINNTGLQSSNIILEKKFLMPCEKNSCINDSSQKAKRGKQVTRGSRIEKLGSYNKKGPNRESFQFHTMDNVIVSIKNATFSWGKCCINLKVDDINIPKGRLTLVVGKSASGKSSLLAALLKEIQQISGYITWNKYSTIAYVPQQPWLINSTIRENILFGESFRPKRYSRILEACALKPDIELMPAGDMTIIGERGINLSGGQKQRIVIARALYSSANVILMDDPLSSLDNEISNHVFQNGINKIVTEGKRTIVLITHKLQLLQNSDYIIAMKDGYVQCAGTYADIENKYSELAMKWNSIITEGNTREEISVTGITDRERLRLFRNVTKIELQRSQSADHDIRTSTSLVRRQSSIYGSLHLTYDKPLSIDEHQDCSIIFKKRSIRNSNASKSIDFHISPRNVFRMSSLQPKVKNVNRNIVARNASSPVASSEFNEDINIDGGFRGFLNRISSKRANSVINTRIQHAVNVSNSIRHNIQESIYQKNKITPTSSSQSENFNETFSKGIDNKLNFNSVTQEERKYGEISMKIYKFYLKCCGNGYILLFFTLAIICQFLRVCTEVWLQKWTENKSSVQAKYYFDIYCSLSILCVIMSIIFSPTGQIAGSKARIVLHDFLLNSMFSKSLHFFQTTNHGNIMNRFSTDIAIIDKKIATTSQRLVQFTLLCLCSILINVIITPWFIISTILLCTAYYIIQKFYRCTSRELQRIESLTTSPIISHFSETLDGVTTIRAFSQESRFMEIIFKRIEANTNASIILNSSNRWLGIALDYLGSIIVFIAILTALTVSSMVDNVNWINDQINRLQPSPSIIGLAINYTLLVPIYLNWVVKLLADMEMYIGAVERIAYLGENKDIDSQDKSCYKSVPISWPQKGDILFDNVSLRYSGQGQLVIKDLTLRIPAGQRIGICGRTGSGKSSLALSLFMALDIIKGQIFVDDIDLTTIHPEEIRSRLSIIPQDVHLFDETIRANLDPRSHYTDLDLWNCLELAQLKDIVNNLPNGLDTKIENGGSNFSVGQKQLFCLARSVLKGSVCLVLDEATSSLDRTTELALLKAANKAFEGKTIINIAHRLSTLLDYDRIIILENGKIIEDGSPSFLQASLSTNFKSMLQKGF